MSGFLTFFHSKDFETQMLILGQLLALDDNFEGSVVFNCHRHVLVGENGGGIAPPGHQAPLVERK